MMRTDCRDGFSWSFLVQHRNIGVVVLLMQPLHTFKQEDKNGCSCSWCQNSTHHQDVSLERCAWLEEVYMELGTQIVPRINTSEIDLQWKEGSNGRLTLVTVTHVDDLFYTTHCGRV